MMRKRVVFPAPLGPMIATSSPLPNEKFTPLQTVFPGYPADRFLAAKESESPFVPANSVFATSILYLPRAAAFSAFCNSPTSPCIHAWKVKLGGCTVSEIRMYGISFFAARAKRLCVSGVTVCSL